MPQCTAKQIDALLPQTQCGLCGYPGCMPYATALANDEAEIDLCPPGGVPGLFALAALLEKDPTPFIVGMEQKAKSSVVAVIREAECIGCTKCIQYCPVDAILGASKSMHTVIADECTGCELCVAPCPVDCIDMVPAARSTDDKKEHYRKRYLAREKRLTQASAPIKNNPAMNKKAYIQEALLRVKQKCL